MNKSAIITELYNSKEFNDCISKMEPDHLRDDLKQEVILVVCEKDESFLQELHGRGGLKFWVTRIVLNMIKSNTSPFYKKYRQPLTEYTEINAQSYTTEVTE